MKDQKVTAEEVLKSIEIMKRLEANGTKIVDWDDRDIEVEYANGDKTRMTETYGAMRLAEMLNGA